jgi:hypothetical protein
MGAMLILDKLLSYTTTRRIRKDNEHNFVPATKKLRSEYSPPDELEGEHERYGNPGQTSEYTTRRIE